MKSILNVKFNRRQEIIKVKTVQMFPGFMVVIDEKDGKRRRHELSEIDFPSYEWEKIKPGATIALTIQDSVTKLRVKPPTLKEYVSNLLAEAKERASGLFFIWICHHCGVNNFVEYEDGDDLQMIAERIISAVQKEAKPGCEHSILIYDHRGERQRDSESFLSSRMAAKAA